MRAVMAGLTGVLALACSKPADKSAETASGQAPATAAGEPAAPSLAAYAGTWNVRSTVTEGQGSALGYVLTATSTRDGWTISFPDREPIPLRVVAVEGDSVVTEAGPFESAIRKGVQVRTRGVARMVDGKLVGTNRARYEVEGADTVSVLEFEGTRAP